MPNPVTYEFNADHKVIAVRDAATGRLIDRPMATSPNPSTRHSRAGAREMNDFRYDVVPTNPGQEAAYLRHRADADAAHREMTDYLTNAYKGTGQGQQKPPPSDGRAADADAAYQEMKDSISTAWRGGQ